MPSAQLVNPQGAFGYSANTPEGTNVVGTYLSAETTTTIHRGELVSINTSGNILQATTSVEPRLVIGIAIEEIPAATVGLVCLHGYITSVPANGAISAGGLVGRSATTAGAVDAVTSAAGTQGQSIGVAVTTAASSLVNVFVAKI